MDPADKTACCAEQVVPARPVAGTFHPGRAHPRLLFNGPFADFVARCREQ